MKLIRFKCDQEKCKKDFYCQWDDVEEAEPGFPLCPFCDEGTALKIGEVQFDDRGVVEKDMIENMVVKFRKEIVNLEEILHNLENITPIMEEENE